MGTIEITESNHKDYSSLEQYKADKKKYEGVYFFCTNGPIKMIADFNTMPHMFWECNRLYFDHQLRTPKFGLMHSYRNLGRFEYRLGEKKKPVKKRHMVILMSDYFDFDEETFRNIMVHEMIHYYLYLNNPSDCSRFSRFLRFFGFKNSDHGPEFMAMAESLNQKYGLNIMKTYDVSNIPSAPNALKCIGLYTYNFTVQKGKLVIPCKWEDANSFENGQAFVSNHGVDCSFFI